MAQRPKIAYLIDAQEFWAWIMKLLKKKNQEAHPGRTPMHSTSLLRDQAPLRRHYTASKNTLIKIKD